MLFLWSMSMTILSSKSTNRCLNHHEIDATKLSTPFFKLISFSSHLVLYGKAKNLQIHLFVVKIINQPHEISSTFFLPSSSTVLEQSTLVIQVFWFIFSFVFVCSWRILVSSSFIEVFCLYNLVEKRDIHKVDTEARI